MRVLLDTQLETWQLSPATPGGVHMEVTNRLSNEFSSDCVSYLLGSVLS
jgi:hypothetical protein